MNRHEVEGLVNTAHSGPHGCLGVRTNARAIITTKESNVLRSGGGDLRLEWLAHSVP